MNNNKTVTAKIANVIFCLWLKLFASELGLIWASFGQIALALGFIISGIPEHNFYF